MAAGYTLYRNTYDGDLSYVDSFGTLPPITSVVDDEMGETYDWSRTGYNFLGWNTARDGSGTMYQPGASPAGGSYYAQWQEIVVTPDVTITYNNSTITTMSASGTEILETNGKMMADDITIEYTKPTPSLQAKTGISPSTSSQTITPDSGYDGLSSVQINAMTTMTLPTSTSSSALGAQKAAITPTTTTKYLNIPIGYNSTRSYYKLNAISPTKAAQTYTPTTSDQTIASGQWLEGAQTILGDANLTAENIKKDVSIFNVTGTYEGSGGGSAPSLSATMPQYFSNINTLIDSSYNNVNMYATPPVGDTIQMYTSGRWELSSLYEKDTGTPVPYTTISTSRYGSQYSFVMPNVDVVFNLYYND